MSADPPPTVVTEIRVTFLDGELSSHTCTTTFRTVDRHQTTGDRSMDMPPQARVTYRGEVHVVGVQDHLLFGRGVGNDLNVERESDDLLHRRFGRLHQRNGIWWITNDGARLSLAVNDRDSTSSIVLAPGGLAALTFQRSSILFSGRRPDYEILVDISGTVPMDDEGLPADTAMSATPTLDQSEMPLVGEQRLLLVALAEQKLRNPHRALELPANKDVQARFGWTRKTFDGKLGRLCEKFDRWGMSGLVGESFDPATNRRRKLVEYAIGQKILTPDDLELLDEYPIIS